MWHGIMDRGPGLFHDFELDRSPCLFLDHGATISHPAAGAYVVDLQADEIATSELAVDREVGMAQTSFGLRGRFWPIKRPLFQGARLQGTGNGIAVCMVAS